MSADIFNEGRIPSLVSMANCTGSEASILDCTGVVTTTGSGFSCPTSGVVCQGKTKSIKVVCALSLNRILHLLPSYKHFSRQLLHWRSSSE